MPATSTVASARRRSRRRAAITGGGRSGAAALQAALHARGLYRGSVDGVAGPMTRAAVRQFQAARGLAVDGIAGRQTRRALGWRGRPGLGARVLRAGARGWDVAALQFLLARQGFPSGPVDGDLGPRTASAIGRFQAWAGLAADGLAGPATLAAARRAPARSPLSFLAPVGGVPGDRFGPRGNTFHTGLDYPLAHGTGVVAAGRGCVQSAGYDSGGYGNLVVIEHRMGMTTWYAHLGRITVSPGACLVAGQPDRHGRLDRPLHGSAPALRDAAPRRGDRSPKRPPLTHRKSGRCSPLKTRMNRALALLATVVALALALGSATAAGRRRRRTVASGYDFVKSTPPACAGTGLRHSPVLHARRLRIRRGADRRRAETTAVPPC